MTTMGLEYQKHLETKRSNLAREFETNRANVTAETETHRSNLENERIRQGTLDEQVRTNQANERIRQGTLEEQIRSNRANEGIKRDTLSETITHNRNTEAISASEAQSAAKQASVAEYRAKEEKRKNIASETFKSIESLPEGAQTVAAYANYLTTYGGDISQSDKKKIRKYLNAATLAGAGTTAYINHINQARDLLIKLLPALK